MARLLDTDTINTLNANGLMATLLCEIYLNSGTVYLCDDFVDLVADVNGTSHTYTGASVIFDSININSSSSLAAESVNILLDGTKLGQAGLPAPLAFYNSIMTEEYQQKRVNFYLAIRDAITGSVVTIWNLYAGKINNLRQVDEAVSIIGEGRVSSNLEITLDSLAARYGKTIGRLRTHEDQLEIDPTDNFFSYATSASQNESSLYWGKAAPKTTQAVIASSPDRTKYGLFNGKKL